MQRETLSQACAPVIIDVAPAWRPRDVGEAVCVLDCVLWARASSAALGRWTQSPNRAAMPRVIMFRLLSDDPPNIDAYARALASFTTRSTGSRHTVNSPVEDPTAARPAPLTPTHGADAWAPPVM
jgi:hypothetical protein